MTGDLIIANEWHRSLSTSDTHSKCSPRLADNMNHGARTSRNVVRIHVADRPQTRSIRLHTVYNTLLITYSSSELYQVSKEVNEFIKRQKS